MLDPAGKVICRARNPQRGGDDLSANPVIAAVLKKKAPARGTIVLSAAALAAEGRNWRRGPASAWWTPPRRAPRTNVVRSDGMVLAVAVPVLDAQGACWPSSTPATS